MKQKDILFIFGSACVIVLTWVLFSVYHASVSSTVSKDLQIKIEPVAPFFDALSIQNLKKRQKVAPSFETPTLSPTPAEQSTQSSQLTQL